MSISSVKELNPPHNRPKTMNLQRAPYICSQCTTQIIRTPLRRLQLRYLPQRAWQRRHNSQSVQADRPFRVAIVGSGPAGFYAAYRLLAKVDDAVVDMYEKLPVPFGLARYGVAPDHPEVKVRCDQLFLVSGRLQFLLCYK
jgi:adrenodoxin-NADP+ reductase